MSILFDLAFIGVICIIYIYARAWAERESPLWGRMWITLAFIVGLFLIIYIKHTIGSMA